MLLWRASEIRPIASGGPRPRCRHAHTRPPKAGGIIQPPTPRDNQNTRIAIPASSGRDGWFCRPMFGAGSPVELVPAARSGPLRRPACRRDIRVAQGRGRGIPDTARRGFVGWWSHHRHLERRWQLM